MLNCLDLTPKTNHQGMTAIYSQCLILVNHKKKHSPETVDNTAIQIKTNKVNSNIDDQSLTKEVYRLCQGYTMQNQQCGKNLDVLRKLYRSILGKYRYTSLE
ncbi:hypothetical protein CLI64_04375 [Nostoc sp. CENA543]|uniref:hypothetical protein n=1 Tax=Nostoc sp. CENA543 TaxID=1869241 RepID=UPI000CA3D80A|nr:hypothetical protein [Nostoc sp. CENA543]AUS99686.1 hypothetical protein CLI64_04375 [Nostoc sp. CENA543]